MSNTAAWIYRQDQELPSLAFDWYDKDGELIPFTSHTFELKLAVDDTTAPVLTKTSGITGSATSPNITIAWASGDLNKTPGTYKVFFKATSGGNDRWFRPGEEPTIVIKPTPASAAP